jgi:hypothetical protein
MPLASSSPNGPSKLLPIVFRGRNLSAKAPVAVGVLEEAHDLRQLSAHLVDAGDVVERHSRLALDVEQPEAVPERDLIAVHG